MEMDKVLTINIVDPILFSYSYCGVRKRIRVFQILLMETDEFCILNYLFYILYSPTIIIIIIIIINNIQSL